MNMCACNAIKHCHHRKKNVVLTVVFIKALNSSIWSRPTYLAGKATPSITLYTITTASNMAAQQSPVNDSIDGLPLPVEDLPDQSEFLSTKLLSCPNPPQDSKCTVCQCDWDDEEVVQITHPSGSNMITCFYHKECVMAWFTSSNARRRDCPNDRVALFKPDALTLEQVDLLEFGEIPAQDDSDVEILTGLEISLTIQEARTHLHLLSVDHTTAITNDGTIQFWNETSDDRENLRGYLETLELVLDCPEFVASPNFQTSVHTVFTIKQELDAVSRTFMSALARWILSVTLKALDDIKVAEKLPPNFGDFALAGMIECQKFRERGAQIIESLDGEQIEELVKDDIRVFVRVYEIVVELGIALADPDPDAMDMVNRGLLGRQRYPRYYATPDGRVAVAHAFSNSLEL
jgi:hypothetical protein